MKELLVTALLGWIALTFPWRLATLGVATLVVSPGLTQFSTAHDHYWDVQNFEYKLGAFGWEIVYTKDLRFQGSPAYGVTSPAERKIYIEESLSWDGRWTVLGHEAGHVFQPAWVDRDQGEVFAQGVSLLLTHSSVRELARHIAGHKLTALEVLIAEHSAIQHAADVLRDR